MGQIQRTLGGRLRAGRLGRLDRLDRTGDLGVERAAQSDVGSNWDVVDEGCWLGGPGRGASGGGGRRWKRSAVVGRDSPPRKAMDSDLVDRLDMRLGVQAGVKDEGSVTRRKKSRAADRPRRH